MEEQEVTAEFVVTASTLAASIRQWKDAELKAAKEAHARELKLARQREHYHREKGALESLPTTPRKLSTRVTLRTFPGVSGLWHALPARLQEYLPIKSYSFTFSHALPREDHVMEMTIDTPDGTIHHSGSGLIFDIRARNAEAQFTPVPFASPNASWGSGPSLCWENWNTSYFGDHNHLCSNLFGFGSSQEIEDFLQSTWGLELDDHGPACPRTFTAFEEFTLALWRMHSRPSNIMLAALATCGEMSISRVMQHWIPNSTCLVPVL
ncbi:hypothetical protein AB1Y20_000519 [Prymnesium parvum]|uniref:Uncharacterized protein n=1 Tax=Prymnesium parvum TaxID=97485 RepID=A0AB34K5I8_PRYPA